VPSRGSQKGTQRREQLLSIAMHHFARDGSRGTSLARIAQEAGITQAGLLHHFPSKEALLHAVLDVLDEQDSISPPPTSIHFLDIFDGIVQLVRAWLDEPDLIGMFTVLLIENLTEGAPLHDRLLLRYQGTRAIARESLRQAQENGEIRADVDVDAKAVEIFAFLNGLETSWLLDRSIPIENTVAQWAKDQRRALMPPQPSPRH
jgi:AcrR family transcriptional regulator